MQWRVIMSRFRKIVVPIDFSETSQDALRIACEIARDYFGQIHLLHVVSDLRQEAWTLDAAGMNFHGLQRQWVELGNDQLANVATVPKLSPTQVTRVVVTGAPVTEIVRYAQEHQADLIVMGTHGHGPIRRFLLGSVADRVLRAALCPVLTVPHKTIQHKKEVTEAAATSVS
jgi:nucleotide-binding universal stress UspA family protein